MALLLAGCATPNAMRKDQPSAAFQSKRPAKDVAICIAERWENSGSLGVTVPVRLRPTQTGHLVSVRNDAWGHTALMADVDDVGTGSQTRYYKRLVLGEGTFDKIVADCQK